MLQTSLDINAQKWLSDRFKDRVQFDEPMSNHTFFRIGGPADAVVTPTSREQLLQLIEWSGTQHISLMVVGNGSNLLVKDNGIRGIVAKMTTHLNQIELTHPDRGFPRITAMAGARLHKLCSFSIDEGLAGLNFALGIPGSVGGAVCMNAGTRYGCIADVLENITVIVMPENEPSVSIHHIERAQLDLSYRKLNWHRSLTKSSLSDPIIMEGCFGLEPGDREKLKQEAEEILRKRKNSQPTNRPNAGCVFKNPPTGESAGYLIEMVGLKGKQIGGAEISSKHANFIVNKGDASAADILALMSLAQESVLKQFKIKLEPEVKIVGS